MVKMFLAEFHARKSEGWPMESLQKWFHEEVSMDHRVTILEGMTGTLSQDLSAWEDTTKVVLKEDLVEGLKDLGVDCEEGPQLSGRRRRPSAGPRRKQTPEQKEKFLTIWKNSELVEDAALHLFNEGQRVSITNVYHTIKGPLHLQGHYDFDYGDAIREVLHDAGWVKKEVVPGVLDWSPPR